ncbi:MAG: helix-turn-helix domain-containing protein [Candidatus Omnitrophota bacterium]
MTLRELSEYLDISEDRLTGLVVEKVIPAYKIGGELLRFRKEQIDAMRQEIEARSNDPAKQKTLNSEKRPLKKISDGSDNGVMDHIRDFFYFNDFYIIAAAIAGVLLAVIFMG